MTGPERGLSTISQDKASFDLPTLYPMAYRTIIIEFKNVSSFNDCESERITRPTLTKPAAPIPAIPRPTSNMGMFWAAVHNALPIKNKTLAEIK